MNDFVEWYRDEDLAVCFDKIPHVGIRYALPSMDEVQKRSIAKYPFVNKTDLGVHLYDYKKGKDYEFTIQKGYCYDGASIPRLFWRLVGSNTDNHYLIASLVHDVLCENHNYVDNDRSFSTNVFNALLKCADISAPQRFLMKNSVACFQTLCCKWGGVATSSMSGKGTQVLKEVDRR